MSIDLNLEPLEATIGAGALIVNDYRITTEPIDGGHRITVTRGSEVQTMDVLDGAQGATGETGPAGPQGEQGPQGEKGEPGKDAPQESVMYTAQSLTDEQQAQARENIAAAGVERLVAMETALAGKLDGTPGTWPEWTEDQQAAAREMIGIDGDYEIIFDVTVEEDCTLINVTTDANGNPFRLKGALLLSYLPASDKAGNYGMQLLHNNSDIGYAVTNVMSTSINTYSKHFAQLHNGLWVIGGTQYNQNFNNYSSGGLNLLIPIITKNDAPYIDGIAIKQLNGGTIKAGATIKIMGVRA